MLRNWNTCSCKIERDVERVIENWGGWQMRSIWHINILTTLQCFHHWWVNRVITSCYQRDLQIAALWLSLFPPQCFSKLAKRCCNHCLFHWKQVTMCICLHVYKLYIYLHEHCTVFSLSHKEINAFWGSMYYNRVYSWPLESRWNQSKVTQRWTMH